MSSPKEPGVPYPENQATTHGSGQSAAERIAELECLYAEEHIKANKLESEAVALLRKAAYLAEIASDWHLEEVEIDRQMVRTYALAKEFRAFLAKLDEVDGGVK